MSRGPGTPSRDLTSVVLCSSRMISMQSSTHSSQINTVGPAISFRTSCWLLPQKELVPLDRGRDHLERLLGMLDVDLVEPRPQRQDLARLNLDVGGLTLGTARGLMDHDPRVRQRESLALGAGG